MQTGPGDRPPRKARRVKPTVVAAPKGDVASSGGDYGMRQARRAAKSAPVKRAQRAVYDQQPTAQKQRIVQNAQGSVKANLAPIHASRVARNQDLAQSQATKDTKSNTDRQRASAYKATDAYLHAVKDAGDQRQQPAHGIDLAARSTLVVPLGTQKDRPRSDAELRRFLATGARPTRTGSTDSLKAENQVLPVQLLRRSVDDYVDINANAVPSLYKLGTTFIHDPKAAGKMLVDPYLELAKHPIKGFSEHPLASTLLLAGVKGGAGRGAGKALRTAPSKTLRRVGSTERQAAATPGTRLADERRYSKDIIDKGVQVAGERIAAKRARKQGVPVAQPRMSEKDIARRVDESVAAAKVVSGKNAAEVQRRARKAVGRKPSAATTLVAQGITDVSKADLHARLAEIVAAAPTLKGRDLERNLENQKRIRTALKGHDETKVAGQAQAYSDLARGQEQALQARDLLDPQVAEATRLTGVAVRRLGAQTGNQARRDVKATAKVQRKTAEKGAKAARRQVRTAEQGFQKAFADARVSVAKRNTSQELKAAEREHRAAMVAAAQAKRAHQQAKIDLGVVKGRSQVLSRNIGGGQAGGHGIHLANEALRASTDRVKAARAAVRDAERRVVVVRSRVRGVAPAEADALLKAIAGRDGARAAAVGARTTAKRARRAHVDTKARLKAGAVPGPNGRLIDVAEMRTALGSNPEPAYVTQQATGVRGRGALPTSRPAISDNGQRTGEVIAKGLEPTSPKTLVDQAVARQNLIDASDNYKGFIDEVAYRETPAKVTTYRKQETADAVAKTRSDETGIEWTSMQAAERIVGKNAKGQAVKRQEFVVVPKAARDRLEEHARSGGQHPLLEAIGSTWRRNVLAFSPRWLTGNLLEAGLRSLVAHAGPRSYLTGRRVLKQLDAIDPAAGAAARARTIGGGNYTAADRLGDSAGQDLGRFANAVRTFGQKPGAKQLADAYGLYTDLVFKALNGTLENQFQTAMLGKALRDHPLMADKTLKLSRQAVEDAAKGLKNTNAQVALGREVDMMYGRYAKFSPGLRSTISTYTPFAAWTINAVQFLTQVLPRDHPVLQSVIASSNVATEGWRKEQGLIARFTETLTGANPAWLQGSIPGKDGSHLRVSRYTPFGLFNSEGNSPLGGLPSLLLPQLSEIMANIQGEDWQGKKLTADGVPSGLRDLLAATATFVEGQVPAASQIESLTGARLPNQRDTQQHEPTVAGRARALFDPFMYTKGKSASASSAGGVALPAGVSKAELDQLVREAAQTAPQISKAELDALLREQGIKP